MGIFGWSYPPGAAGDPNAPWNQEDGPCEVCGNDVDHCICTECPECGSVGNPKCYAEHGMVRTQEQILSLAWEEAHWEAANRAEAEYWIEYAKEEAAAWADEEAARREEDERRGLA